MRLDSNDILRFVTIERNLLTGLWCLKVFRTVGWREHTYLSECKIRSYKSWLYLYVYQYLHHPTSAFCPNPNNLPSLYMRGEKKSGALNCLWGRRSPNFWTSQSRFPSSKWFFRCEHSIINKLLVITEPAIPNARLLGLRSKLCPSNMPRMLNKDLTRFMQSLSQERQGKGSAGRLYLHQLI